MGRGTLLSDRKSCDKKKKSFIRYGNGSERKFAAFKSDIKLENFFVLLLLLLLIYCLVSC